MTTYRFGSPEQTDCGPAWAPRTDRQTSYRAARSVFHCQFDHSHTLSLLCEGHSDAAILRIEADAGTAWQRFTVPEFAPFTENSPDSPVGTQRASVGTPSKTAYVRISAVEYESVSLPNAKSVPRIFDWCPSTLMAPPCLGTVRIPLKCLHPTEKSASLRATSYCEWSRRIRCWC